MTQESGQPMPAAAPLYWCSWPTGFIYGGLPLDQGQVFPLRGLRNDAQLVRLGYVIAVEGTPPLATCGVCGAEFIADTYRDGHSRKRHSRAAARITGVPSGAGLAYEDRTGVDEDRLNEAALRGGER